MYNNPYLYQNLARPSLFSRLFRGAAGSGAIAKGAGINWGTLLTNTQKSLGIINQAIPLVYQVKPIFSNAKTMFKIADALKSDKKSTSSNSNHVTNNNSNNIDDNNLPIFYI